MRPPRLCWRPRLNAAGGRQPRQIVAAEAPQALAGSIEQRLLGGEAHPHEARRCRPESAPSITETRCVSYSSRMNSKPDRPVSRTSISRNIPASGTTGLSATMSRIPAAKRSAARAKIAHACLGRRGDAERRERRLLNESRQTEQHADRERLGVCASTRALSASRRASRAWHAILDRLPMVTTCSGKAAARLGTLPPGASPAYTSSATTHRAWRRASSPMAAISAALMMTPLGLFGVAKKIARVRGVIARPRAPSSPGRKPPAAGAATRTMRAPETSMVAG